SPALPPPRGAPPPLPPPPALGAPTPAGPIHVIDNPIASMPFLQGRLTALAVLLRYSGLLLWPASLSIDYSLRSIPEATDLFDPRALAGAACLLVWAVLVARLWSRAPGMAFALALGGEDRPDRSAEHTSELQSLT